MKKKKLLIDVNSIVPYYVSGKVNGIGRTTLELLQALADIDNLPFEIELYSQNMKGIGGRNTGLPFKSTHLYLPHREKWNKVLAKFPIREWLTKYDIMHIPHNSDYTENIAKTIFTFHDLIAYRYPAMWGVNRDDDIFDFIKYLAQNCKAIVTCSESSKKDIIDILGVSERKVTAIPWGVNRDIFCPIYDYNFLLENDISSLYYFTASCNHPRKNLPLLLRSYKEYLTLGGEGQLILLNPIESDLLNVQDLIKEHKIVVFRNISDKELAVLYTHAHCSIVLSEFEGFGLPILESLSCGTIVLSSYNSSLIEAGGNIVDYFDELKEPFISEKMLKYDKILKQNILNKTLLDEHLNKFSWKECAKSYERFYKQQLNND